MRHYKAAMAAFAFVIPAASFGQYHTSYTINRSTDQAFGIDKIFMLERGPGFGSGTWAFSIGAGETLTTLTNPFETPNIPAEALLIGIAHDLPNDAPGQKHIVLMMDDQAAQLSNGIGWGTLFRNTLEDQLIADIELGASGGDGPTIQPGLDGLDAFTNGDAVTGILDNQGQPRSAWFSFGSSFTVVAWSDGQIIGSGTSVAQPVPEPTTLAVAGFGLVALAKRRRSRP